MAEQIFRGNFSDPIFAAAERYNVYVMGPVPFYMSPAEREGGITGNYWTSFGAWPAATPTNWYLASGGVATAEPPAGDDDSEWTYT